MYMLTKAEEQYINVYVLRIHIRIHKRTKKRTITATNGIVYVLRIRSIIRSTYDSIIVYVERIRLCIRFRFGD